MDVGDRGQVERELPGLEARIGLVLAALGQSEQVRLGKPPAVERLDAPLVERLDPARPRPGRRRPRRGRARPWPRPASVGFLTSDTPVSVSPARANAPSVTIVPRLVPVLAVARDRASRRPGRNAGRDDRRDEPRLRRTRAARRRSSGPQRPDADRVLELGAEPDARVVGGGALDREELLRERRVELGESTRFQANSTSSAVTGSPVSPAGLGSGGRTGSVSPSVGDLPAARERRAPARAAARAGRADPSGSRTRFAEVRSVANAGSSERGSRARRPS